MVTDIVSSIYVPNIQVASYLVMNLKHFDTNLMAAADCGYMVVIKNRPKNDFTWVEIA